MRTNFRQAIVTKYFGPGNVKGSRIKARAYAGSITIQYDCSKSLDENHIAAANEFQKRFSWDGFQNLIGGTLPSGEYVFVGVDK